MANRTDYYSVRQRSFEFLAKHGYVQPKSLPLLDSTLSLRPLQDILERVLALNVIVSFSFGYKKENAMAWLERERLLEKLSPTEIDLLNGERRAEEIQDQVEALHAFAWALQHLDKMDFCDTCPDNLVNIFPDLRIQEPSIQFRNNSSLRSYDELVLALDLSYCLHWNIVEASLRGKSIPHHVPAYATIERRRALEWILSEEDWDDISLDT